MKLSLGPFKSDHSLFQSENRARYGTKFCHVSLTIIERPIRAFGEFLKEPCSDGRVLWKRAVEVVECVFEVSHDCRSIVPAGRQGKGVIRSQEEHYRKASVKRDKFERVVEAARVEPGQLKDLGAIFAGEPIFLLAHSEVPRPHTLGNLVVPELIHVFACHVRTISVVTS